MQWGGGGTCWNEKCLVDKSGISEAWPGTTVQGGEVYCDILLWSYSTPSLLWSVEWSGT